MGGGQGGSLPSLVFAVAARIFSSPRWETHPKAKPRKPKFQYPFLAYLQCWGALSFSCSVLSDYLRPPGVQASLSFTVSWSLLKLISIELMMPSNHLILCRPLLLLPSLVSTPKAALSIVKLSQWWARPGPPLPDLPQWPLGPKA